MNIKTYQDEKGKWVADFSELSGSPYIGDGETEAMAVATLFIRVFSDAFSNSGGIMNLLKQFGTVSINDILYK